MIDDIKQAIKEAANDVTWAKGRAAMDDHAPEWLAALVEYYEAMEALPLPGDLAWKRLQAARKRLEGK